MKPLIWPAFALEADRATAATAERARYKPRISQKTLPAIVRGSVVLTEARDR